MQRERTERRTGCNPAGERRGFGTLPCVMTSQWAAARSQGRGALLLWVEAWWVGHTGSGSQLHSEKSGRRPFLAVALPRLLLSFLTIRIPC